MTWGYILIPLKWAIYSYRFIIIILRRKNGNDQFLKSLADTKLRMGALYYRSNAIIYLLKWQSNLTNVIL